MLRELWPTICYGATYVASPMWARVRCNQQVMELRGNMALLLSWLSEGSGMTSSAMAFLPTHLYDPSLPAHPRPNMGFIFLWEPVHKAFGLKMKGSPASSCSVPCDSPGASPSRSWNARNAAGAGSRLARSEPSFLPFVSHVPLMALGKWKPGQRSLRYGGPGLRGFRASSQARKGIFRTENLGESWFGWFRGAEAPVLLRAMHTS